MKKLVSFVESGRFESWFDKMEERKFKRWCWAIYVLALIYFTYHIVTM